MEAVEDVPNTIPAALDRAARRFGAVEAMVDGESRLDFAAFAAAVDVAARSLIASGVEPGDRIAIWGPNCAEWAIAAFAVHGVGAVLVPMNTRFKRAEAHHIINASAARMLFTVTDFLGVDHVALLGEPPLSLTEIVVLQGPPNDAAVSWSSFLARADAVAPAVSASRRAAVRPDDLCEIMFTSGTTGAPKGAMLRHEATVRAFTSWADVVGLREGDRYLIVNPFFHTFGLKAGLLACVLKGATMVPHPVFDAPSVMRRVDEEEITMLPGPPAIFQTILDHPDVGSYRLSSLRIAVTGAATVPMEMIRRMRSDLGFETIVVGYGLTESTGMATMCRHDDDIEIIARTSGRAIPDVEVIVADTAGAPLPPGQPGEVLIRGYNVMAGFFGDPEATADAIDAAGWLHTGDIGILDEAGNLRITDRLKDMFITGGFNAYPAEIEGMMMEHPSVSQVAVIGVPDHRLGEVAKAFVVPRAGAQVDPDGLIAWCRERMANYKVPRSVEVLASLPLNASSKVQKFVLRTPSGTT